MNQIVPLVLKPPNSSLTNQYLSFDLFVCLGYFVCFAGMRILLQTEIFLPIS